MIRIIFFIIQLIAILSIVGILFSNSFIVSFDIGEYQYSFSSEIFIAIFIVLFFTIFLILFFYFKTRFIFYKIFLNRKISKLQKGYSFFVDGMIAVANNDNMKAISSNTKVSTHLKNDRSLTLLLQAEVYKIEKKYGKLNGIYEEMIKIKNTETLGYRGLMKQNLYSQDYHHAYIYGEKLFNLNPKIEKLYDTLVLIIAKTKNWNQLIFISKQAYAQGVINKGIYEENLSIAYYEIAKIKMDSDLDESEKLIQKGLKLKKYYPPYIKLYLKILFEGNNNNHAIKIMKKAWRENPSSSLRHAITSILTEYDLIDLDLVNSLVDKNAHNEESKKLIIYFAIILKQWELARLKIKGLIGTRPTKEICLFMADIEIGEFNDKQKKDSWILRSENADLDKIWVCKITNQVQKEWESLSVSGHFNSLEWRHPKMLNHYSQ